MSKKTAVIPSLTRNEVREICKSFRHAAKSGMGSTLRRAFSEKLSGQTLNLVFDHLAKLKYFIESGEKIRWSVDGKEEKVEYAQILELETSPGVFLINHLRSGTFPLENVTLIVDVENKAVTLILAELGAAERPRDVQRTIHFGCFSDMEIRTKHQFTTDLVGKIINWHYEADDSFIVKHLYVNNEHMVYVLLNSEAKEQGLVEASECDYIKIRDHVYLMSWLEKGHQGMQGVALIDLFAMQDIGSFFGINISGKLDNYTFAANGEYSTLGKQII